MTCGSCTVSCFLVFGPVGLCGKREKIIYHLFSFHCRVDVGGCNKSPGGFVLPLGLVGSVEYR